MTSSTAPGPIWDHSLPRAWVTTAPTMISAVPTAASGVRTTATPVAAGEDEPESGDHFERGDGLDLARAETTGPRHGFGGLLVGLGEFAATGGEENEGQQDLQDPQKDVHGSVLSTRGTGRGGTDESINGLHPA